MLKSFDPIHLAGIGNGAIEVARERSIEDRVDKRGFSASRHARNGDKAAERNIHVKILEVVFSRADDAKEIAVAGSSGLRHFDDASTCEIIAGDGILAGSNLLWRACHDDLAAVDSRAGADVDYKIGIANCILIVLYNDNAIAEVAQILEG